MTKATTKIPIRNKWCNAFPPIGDKITAYYLDMNSRNSYKGTIINIKSGQRDAKLTAIFEPKFRDAFNHFNFSIKIDTNRAKFIRKHKAIDMVKAMYNKDSLFPTAIESSTSLQLNVDLTEGYLVYEDIIIPWFDGKLDRSQKMAVKSVLRAECPELPYVINGPPGK